MTLSVLCWKWGRLFSATYVNKMRNMLERNLNLPHELFCVTDDPRGIDERVNIITMPQEHKRAPRCQRRIRQFDKEFASRIGERILSIDLDVVLVDDITPIVDRPEPIVCWKVGYAGVFCGSFVLYDAAALDGLWRAFDGDPQGYGRKAQPIGTPSDQPMLNYYLRGQDVPYWTEEDGFVTYFGRGYEEFEHFGVGQRMRTLPSGARLVVLGSADKAALDSGAYEWIREHWR